MFWEYVSTFVFFITVFCSALFVIYSVLNINVDKKTVLSAFQKIGKNIGDEHIYLEKNHDEEENIGNFYFADENQNSVKKKENILLKEVIINEQNIPSLSISSKLSSPINNNKMDSSLDLNQGLEKIIRNSKNYETSRKKKIKTENGINPRSVACDDGLSEKSDSTIVFGKPRSCTYTGNSYAGEL